MRSKQTLLFFLQVKALIVHEMRYIKGDYTTVPNRSALNGLPAIVQSVFLNICSYANKDGSCFPSIETLSKDSGCGRTAAIETLAELEKIGLLSRESRKRENKTNLYHIMILPVNTEVREADYPTSATRTTPSPPGDHRTKPILTKPKELFVSGFPETEILDQESQSQTPPFTGWWGFPLPSGWSDEGGLDSEGDNRGFLLDEDGQRVKLSEIRKRKYTYLRELSPRKIPESVVDAEKFIAVYQKLCQRETGVVPKYGVKERTAIAQALKRIGWENMSKVAVWYLKSEVKNPHDKLNLFNLCSNFTLNRYQADTGNQL